MVGISQYGQVTCSILLRYMFTTSKVLLSDILKFKFGNLGLKQQQQQNTRQPKNCSHFCMEIGTDTSSALNTHELHFYAAK